MPEQRNESPAASTLFADRDEYEIGKDYGRGWIVLRPAGLGVRLAVGHRGIGHDEPAILHESVLTFEEAAELRDALSVVVPSEVQPTETPQWHTPICDACGEPIRSMDDRNAGSYRVRGRLGRIVEKSGDVASGLHAPGVLREVAVSLRLVPISLGQANEHVAAWHRHNRPVPGAKFSIGAADELGVLHAVAICGRPVARVFDDGDTIEVCRVASDGTRNANSMLYGACARAAFALGYRRVITYTQVGEGGASLRAANWKVIAERPARKGWSVPSRPRDNGKYVSSNRQLWEAVA